MKEGKKMNNLQLIEKVLYYIDEHICEELTYERLAEVFGYSSFHFHKIFSSVTELSITEYIRKRRLTMHIKYYVRQQRPLQIFVIKLVLIVFRLLIGCLRILLECSHLWQGKGKQRLHIVV